MKIVVHNTVQTMSGQGFEALSPDGSEWIALFMDGNLHIINNNNSLSTGNGGATDGPTLPLIDKDAA
jgi:hypothetical protein